MMSTASHETGRRPQEEAMLARAAQEEVGQGQQVVSVLHSSDLQVWRLLENLPAGAYTCDADGLITYFNQHAVRLWGRAPQLHNPVDRFCGSFKLLLPDGSPIAHDQCWMALALKMGQAYNGHEIMIERPDGQRLTVLAHANPIVDDAGHLLGAVNVLVDITERQQAAEMQQHLAAIIESSDDAIIGQTLEGIITSWNRGAERLYGYTTEDVVGQPIAMLVPPDLPDELPQILAHLQCGERIDHYETQRLRKDGTRLDVSLTISPIRNASGRIIGASKIARDITARKQMAMEAARKQREDEVFVELAQTLNASLDLDTVLQRVVEAAQELSCSERALIFLRNPGTETLVTRYQVGAPEIPFADLRIAPGKGIGGLVLATGRPQRTADYATDPHFSKDYLARMRAGGQLAVIAVPMIIGAHVAGVFYVSNHCSQPFTDRDEEVLRRLAAYAATAIHNAQLYRQAQEALAERQRAEEALQHAHAVLEQRVQARTAELAAAVEALQREVVEREQAETERRRLEEETRRAEHFALLGRLAAGVSHEIRNPLGIIYLQADILEEELQRLGLAHRAPLLPALSEIKANLARLDDLVQDYLSLVRVATIQQESADLGAVVKDFAQKLEADLTARGITLKRDGLSQLGQVALHHNTFRRALLNLVQNAMEAMPQGGSLTLRGLQTVTQVQLEVSDTGVGLPAEQLGQIFEPLYTTKPGGTGLGLYLVREIVTAHGGEITVQSEVGHGTTFVITLPRLEATG
jgi:PAS domain S-box-containing protein